ncbi:hypothetical protein BOW53_12185 [Solemya pervernicosa gill symbiont]|uniref:Sulfotransferase domain-containing protein n=2 Tax=Gammaproteobacteria incertae sedis TaxID=118884 RepID=A0A1T2L2P2_9GAMM|nr:hypothetical protein BOW53_12185 [Solemya pervernicosa gill symbiont]
MKSGTTSLYQYLIQHPQIKRAQRKEVHYFNSGRINAGDTYKLGEKWYRSHFPLRMEMRGKICGEATPMYLLYPHVPARIHQTKPDTKLILLLRNSTERAISHYFHEINRDCEVLPIMEALEAEDSRLEKSLNTNNFQSNEYRCHAYKLRGHYRKQIERYLQFFDREQLLILNSERLFTQPEETLREVYQFLDVDDGYKIPDLKPRNVGTRRTVVNAEVYDYLNRYFAPHNEALFELLGERYDW